MFSPCHWSYCHYLKWVLPFLTWNLVISPLVPYLHSVIIFFSWSHALHRLCVNNVNNAISIILLTTFYWVFAISHILSSLLIIILQSTGHYWGSKHICYLLSGIGNSKALLFSLFSSSIFSTSPVHSAFCFSAGASSVPPHFQYWSWELAATSHHFSLHINLSQSILHASLDFDSILCYPVNTMKLETVYIYHFLNLLSIHVGLLLKGFKAIGVNIESLFFISIT